MKKFLGIFIALVVLLSCDTQKSSSQQNNILESDTFKVESQDIINIFGDENYKTKLTVLRDKKTNKRYLIIKNYGNNFFTVTPLESEGGK